MKYFLALSASIIFLFLPEVMSAQYTHEDSLRGSINAGRDWWNVTRYDIRVTPDYASKSILGSNTISFKWLRPSPTAGYMQIDLQQPLIIDRVIYKNRSLNFKRDGNVCFIEWPSLDQTSDDSISIFYHGKPREAVNAPWDGGWVWTKDEKGRPWMTVTCQGLGASSWYPCKDHQSDEPDKGASLTITVADSLVAIGN